MTSNVETARAFFEAAFHDDYDTCRRLIGDNYVFINRPLGMTARSPEELRLAQHDVAWSNSAVEFENIMETTDGAVIVQTTEHLLHTGTFRSVPPKGRPVDIQACHILRFDDQHRIVSHDFYDDHLSILVQLGALDAADWQ